MSIYRTISGSKGTRYMKDGKMISKGVIPSDIIDKLKVDKEVSDIVEVDPRSCLFCGSYAKLQRMVNLQTVYLCEDHYYDKTVGQIAHELNSKSSP